MREELLKHYFEQESKKGDLSAEQWERVLSQVKIQDQMRGVLRAVTLLIARRPLIAMMTTLVLAVVAGGTSLWIVAPWTAAPQHEPTPTQARLGIPAPRILEQVWKADKNLITPGEPIMITLALKNVSDRPVVFSEFPTTMTLTQVDEQIEESIPLELKGREGTPGPIEPGEEFIVVATVTPGVSAGLQPGRYNSGVRVQFTHSPGRPEMGGTRRGMGLNSEILFVVIPPEGVLDGTVMVGQVEEGSYARITLESVRFTLEQTSILVFAEPLAHRSVERRPTVASTPTPAVQPQVTATPASLVVPSPWDGDITRLTAFYRLDGGAWHLLRNHGYRPTPDGVHHEWWFGPVSVNANTLEFAILPGNRPGRDGTFTYPTSDATASWEWSVPLRDIERR